jgi:hypothetical protein
MKRLLLIIAVLASTAAFAQETKDKASEPEYNTTREFRNRVFTLQFRNPDDIASAVNLLGSGFKGAGLNVNSRLRTITVRDYPENLVAIEEAIKRLDVEAPPERTVELKISVLIGSKTPLANAPIPDELAPVVKQLQSTLSYAHYGVMTSSVHRTKTGSGIEGSGVAEATLLGMTADQSRPILYSYKLRDVKVAGASERPTFDVNRFEFSMRVPLDLGSGSIQYQSVGFDTPVSIRQNEKVVIGTTTMRDKALVVVVTAKVE